MFDTGAQTALEIDDHKVVLNKGKLTGKGFVGSGQLYETHRYDTVQNVRIGQVHLINAGPVTGHDFSYMNHITSDILSLTGYKFFEDYIFKLDYRANRITFYKSTPARLKTQDFLKNEKVLTVLNFEIRKLPNHPVIPIVVGKDTLAVTFDTGQLGTLALSDTLKQKWISSGNLSIRENSPIGEIKWFEFLKGIVAKPCQFVLYTPQNQAGVKKSIGITESNSMTLGYGFLSQFKTVWDFKDHKIYLLQP